MARQMLAVVGLALAASACFGSSAEPSTTASSSMVTTVTTSTVATVVSFDVPRLGSTTEHQPLPMQVIEDAVLHVDGSCVTAETAGKTILLVIDFRASVLGSDVRFDGFAPGVVPTRVLSSGVRYQLRGVPDAFDTELAEPMPPGCEYDERLLLLGALDSPVEHGLATYPVEVWVGFGAIGTSAEITIDGPCATINHPNGKLLVIWPEGTVSLVDDHTIHVSRWEGFTEMLIRSGDTLSLQGHEDGPVANPPPNCDFDGTFTTGAVRPPRP